MNREDLIATIIAKITDGLFTDEELIGEINSFKEQYDLTDDEVLDILDTAEDLIDADNQADADSEKGVASTAMLTGDNDNIEATKKALEEVDSIDDSVFEDYTKHNATNRLANMLSAYRW